VVIAIGMAASIETFGTMAANSRGGLSHTAGSTGQTDCVTKRLIHAVRLMVSVPASRSMVSTVSGSNSSCINRRGRISVKVVIVRSFQATQKSRRGMMPRQVIPSPPHFQRAAKAGPRRNYHSRRIIANISGKVNRDTLQTPLYSIYII
jgi:hypothetical protein